MLYEVITKVDGLDEQRGKLFAAYKEASAKLESARTYNEQLREMIASQQEETLSLNRQLEEIRITSYNVCYTKLLRVPDDPLMVAQGTVGVGAGKEVVFKDDHPTDDIDPLVMVLLNQGAQVLDGLFTVGADGFGFGDIALIGEVAVFVFDVDDDGIDLGLFHEGVDPLFNPGASRPPKGEVKDFGVHIQRRDALGFKTALVLRTQKGQGH